jgi:putative endonuclease
MSFYVYILASGRNGTLYIGYTDDLHRRVSEHKAHSLGGFTAKYNVTKLVFFEEHDGRETAFVRERRMKVWRRRWKVELIERFNPAWRDLFEDMQGDEVDAESWLQRRDQY